MSTRNRSEDLAADLMHDIVADEAAPSVRASVAPAPRSMPPPPTSADQRVAGAPSAFLATALFLAPAAWSRPGIIRSATTVTLSAGPIRLRVGRGLDPCWAQ